MKTLKISWKSLFVSLFFIAGGLTAQAQLMPMNPVGHLTVFSDDGTKFYLYLNGERYNDIPEVNVRIEDLPNPYYNCKIVFENEMIPAISKNRLMVTDYNNVMHDVTYRIKADKRGKYTIAVYSFVPVQQHMVRPSNCAVYQYGVPHQPMIGSNGVIYRETIHTQNTIGINAPGVNVNVNVPGMTNTTTITQYETYPNGYVNPYPNQPYLNNPNNVNYNRCQFAMNAGDYENARRVVANNGFDETRLSAAQQIASSNCLSAGQIAGLLNTFSFEETKLNFAKYAYLYCVDRGNYFNVINSFSFESSKIELNNYIQTVR